LVVWDPLGNEENVSLLPEGASFEELVQDCFLAYRGSGVMVSALDAELLSEWAGRGVPYEVVARGIRRAAEAALFDAAQGEAPVRSLRACRKQVEAEIKKHLGRAAGQGEAPKASEPAPHLKRHRKLKAALRKFASESPRHHGVVTHLLEGRLAREVETAREASVNEEAVYLALLRSLPFVERIELLRQSRQLAQNGSALSAQARRLSRRFHQAAVLRRVLGLPSFW
jgi:hypothetical protein